jgi:transposase InsO family protein
MAGQCQTGMSALSRARPATAQQIAQAPGQGETARWQIAGDGRKIRVLTVIDTFTRLSPAMAVRQSFRGIDVVATLERVTHELGHPETIRLDNGPEFISKELDL